MSGKIRGHYRIDSTGRVLPLVDVNALMKPYSIPLTRLRDNAANQKSRIIKISLVGFTLFSICIGGMLVLPQIERSMIAAKSQEIAAARSAFFRGHPGFRSRGWHYPVAEN